MNRLDHGFLILAERVRGVLDQQLAVHHDSPDRVLQIVRRHSEPTHFLLIHLFKLDVSAHELALSACEHFVHRPELAVEVASSAASPLSSVASLYRNRLMRPCSPVALRYIAADFRCRGGRTSPHDRKTTIIRDARKEKRKLAPGLPHIQGPDIGLMSVPDGLQKMAALLNTSRIEQLTKAVRRS